MICARGIGYGPRLQSKDRACLHTKRPTRLANDVFILFNFVLFNWFINEFWVQL